MVAKRDARGHFLRNPIFDGCSFFVEAINRRENPTGHSFPEPTGALLFARGRGKMDPYL